MDSIDGLTEVVVTATGRIQRVPPAWLDDQVLSRGIEKSVRQRVLDGEISADDVAQAPTVKSTVAEIDDFAAQAGIDIGEAKTKAEKVAVIEEALAAAPIPDDVDVDVADPQNPDDTESPDETPASGGQE